MVGVCGCYIVKADNKAPGAVQLIRTVGGRISTILRFSVGIDPLLIGNVVVAHQVFHLSLCPVAVLGGLVVVGVLIVYHCDQLGCGVIPGAAPGVQPEVPLGADLANAAGHVGIQRFLHACPAVHFLVGAFAGCFLVLVNEVRVHFADDLAQYALNTAPHIVPAVYIAGCCVIIVVGVDLLQVRMVAGDLIHPGRRPAVVVLPLGGAVVLLGAVPVVAELLFVIPCKVIQRICIL